MKIRFGCKNNLNIPTQLFLQHVSSAFDMYLSILYLCLSMWSLLSDSWIVEIPAPREFYCDTQVNSLIILFIVDSYHVCHRKGMLTVAVKFLL